MDVAVVTVGEELLSGETENTNATWLARRITEQGSVVEIILTIGDERETIAEYVEEFHGTYDAVVVSGGLGGTHDDVTMEAVADAFDRKLTVEQAARTAVEKSSREFVENHPDLAERYDLGLDVDAWAATVDGGEPIENPEGLSPGCVVEGVYVLPGVPAEMRGTFEQIAEDFGGDRISETIRTDAPEGALTTVVEQVQDTFDVSIGIYPGDRPDPNRLTIRGTDRAQVGRAVRALREEVDEVEE